MEKKRSGNLGIGFTFIIVGLLLLAYRFGYLHFNVLWAFVRLWPLIFIVIGLNILFRHHAWIRGLVWIAFILGVVLYGSYVQDGTGIFWFTNNDYDLTEARLEVPLDSGTKTGKLGMTLGAGELRIGSTDDALVSIVYPEEITDVTSRFLTGGGYALDMEHSDTFLPQPRLSIGGFNYRADLNEALIWDLDLDLGAMDIEMDFRDLDLSSLDLDMGAGDIELYLGEAQRDCEIKIDSGVADVHIYLPEDAEAQLNFDGGIKDLTFRGNDGFGKYDDTYRTPGYGNTAVGYDLDISTGVGELTIETY